jgi:hypothetical protein
MKKKILLAAFILMAIAPLSVGDCPGNTIVNTSDTSGDRGREISPRPNCGPDLGGCSASL